MTQPASAVQARPFHTVLVANRGEIALRILRTLRRLGYGSVAVYAEDDRDSPHVHGADQAVCIGSSARAQPYLDIEALLAAARRTGADAIHPGYGFLSENDAFADAVQAAGLVFIGPSGQSIRAMGHKAGAKQLMLDAGVPCIPGYEGEDASDATLLREAARIGFPIMCKAAAGGGGRGMRRVERAEDLPVALASARSEARSAFGDETLILERALDAPRHVEIQLLADHHGQVLHLGERDCSVQRRHQKLIEEAPSPAVDAALRARMGEAAVHSARALGYVGAGTMEFLLDGDGQFYFMEMNTRLQVEHAVTEAVTGLDLVEWQLRVAAGERLSWQQQDIRLQGHAIEVRLTVEDVSAGFLPQTGPVLRWRPPEAHVVRLDSALVEGGEVSPHYDSMVAKLVAHGRDREEARRKLWRALQDCVLLGVANNQGFLADCLADPVFVRGEGVHTGFVAERMGLPPAMPVCAERTLAFAALAAQAQHLPVDARQRVQAGALGRGEAHGVLQGAAPLRVADEAGAASALTGVASWRYSLRVQEDGWRVWIAPDAASQDGNGVSFVLTHLRWRDASRGLLEFECEGLHERLCLARTAQAVHVFHAGRAWSFDCPPPRSNRTVGAVEQDAVRAPLTARVLQVSVEAGQTVRAGDALLVLEAMKMEHVLSAPRDGCVRRLHVQAGGQAVKGALLIEFEAQEGAP